MAAGRFEEALKEIPGDPGTLAGTDRTGHRTGAGVDETRSKEGSRRSVQPHFGGPRRAVQAVPGERWSSTTTWPGCVCVADATASTQLAGTCPQGGTTLDPDSGWSSRHSGGDALPARREGQGPGSPSQERLRLMPSRLRISASNVSARSRRAIPTPKSLPNRLTLLDRQKQFTTGVTENTEEYIAFLCVLCDSVVKLFETFIRQLADTIKIVSSRAVLPTRRPPSGHPVLFGMLHQILVESRSGHVRTAILRQDALHITVFVRGSAARCARRSFRLALLLGRHRSAPVF